MAANIAMIILMLLCGVLNLDSAYRLAKQERYFWFLVSMVGAGCWVIAAAFYIGKIF